MSNENILSPAKQIKPPTDKNCAKELVNTLYGLEITYIQELNGYDDKNYLIMCHEIEIKNPHITNVSKDGYVLKVMNCLDSRNTSTVEAQNAVLGYLNKTNIVCPRVIKQKDGSLYSLQKFKGNDEDVYAVRLLTYIPGEILVNASVTKTLLTNVGHYLAKLDESLQSFTHPGFQDLVTVWNLISVPKLRNFIFAVESEDDRRLVEDVIVSFETKVLNNIDQFDRSVIHGDFNEQNVIVTSDKVDVAAILDFGDAHEGYLIFELAITLCYMLMQAKDIEMGKHVIKGYETVRQIKRSEKNILRVCICARLCQSLVLGAYSYRKDPQNQYVLHTQKFGWTLLKNLWAMTDEDILRVWDISGKC